MPDRILRANILTSDPVNSLCWPAEVFYRRLMSVVDDFGRYDARPSILRANLYALKLNYVSEADIVKWMNDCSEAGLVSFYEVEGKRYLELLKFDQRLRAKKSKYPEPAVKCQQMLSDVVKCSGDGDGRETETDAEEPPPNSIYSGALKKDRMFFEQLGNSWGINQQAFEKMIDEFVLHLNKNHPNQAEFKSHFFNWGCKKYTNYLPKKKSNYEFI